jgi:signal transduction histidine kinase
VRIFIQLHAQRRELERLAGLYDAQRVTARKRVQTLAKVSARLSRLLSADEVAQVVITEAHDALRASASVAYVESENESELVLLAGRGIEADWLPRLRHLPLDAPLPLTAAVRSGQPVWVESREALVGQFPSLGSTQVTQALAAIPLIVGDRSIGGVAFSFDHPASWDTAEQEFLLTLSAQFAAALERSRLLNAERASHEELKRRTEAMRLMADMGSLLSSTLDYEEVLRKLTEVVVPIVADWCAVDVLDSSGRIQRLVAHHADPAKGALPLEIERRYPGDPDAPRGVSNVLRTGETEWVPEIPDPLPEGAVRDEDELRSIRQLGLASYVVVPIKARERILGALSLVYSTSRRHYGVEDVAFLEQLAARAAVSVDNALLFREAQRLIEQLDKSNKELDQFAYVASHDLKAPLRGIANLSQWLEEDLGDAITESGRKQLDLLRNRVQRMEGLINGILDYSRAGRVRAKPELVVVAELLSEVVEMSATSPGWHIEIGPCMPSIRTERVPLQQVFLNLVGNALKHAKRADPFVRIGVADQGDWLEFFVSDNGPGIAPEFHERIWAIFQTLEPRDTVEGTGIGLSIVQKIVESKGGRTWVESEPGAGATFRFTWPKAEREAVTGA